MTLSTQTRKLVRAALAEDLGRRGDLTTKALIPRHQRARACIVARESGVAAGLEVAALAFRECDRSLKVKFLVHDGQPFHAGQALLEVSGKARPILTAERTALNFLRHLCGVATLTSRFAHETKGTRARIYDTRKTTPLLRALEKHAVVCGGGENHRFGLYDMVLIKDNHIAAAGSVGEAVRRARAKSPRGIPVQVECDTLAQVKEALAAKPDLLLCDNMSPAQLRAAVRLVGGRCPVEASGGVKLRTVHAIARTGVDRISVGAITHSAGQIDLGLDFIEEKKTAAPKAAARKTHPSRRRQKR